MGGDQLRLRLRHLQAPLKRACCWLLACVQEKEEVVETPTMLHIMGQNNLLQRTGFRGGDAEQLED